MNQWLADIFLALPRGLTDPLVFGSLMLVLCWLAYVFYLRVPLSHRAVWLTLIGVSVAHVALFVFARRGVDACGVADRVLLTFTVTAVGAASLWAQPRATVERRTRWGFGRPNAVVHAILWEMLIAIFVLLWLYDAWFLPAFAI